MIEHTDLSVPVYEKLKEMILSNELKPGEKLKQEKLASLLGVSRTPLLKAMQMLEYDYLVESIPRRGMFVKKLSMAELMDIYEVREAIETVAVRLVIQRASNEQIYELKSLWKPFAKSNIIDRNQYQLADNRFHALLLEYSGNNILKKTYNSSLLQARVVQMGIMRSPEETLPEHLSLMDAIEARNIEEADRIIKLHMRKSKENIPANKD